MRFRALIEATGKTAAGVEVPAGVVAALGPSRKPPVRATINDYTYRSSIAWMGDRFMLSVSNEVRARSGVNAGETVDIDIELDTEPREVDLPNDFAEALAADPTAQAFFSGLSYSNKRRIVEPIGQAKAAETRQRRIVKAIATLHEERI